MRSSIYFSTILLLALSSGATAVEPSWPEKTHYRSEEVLGEKIFYREAGESNAPVILLLHGYPSSSHTYRELIPLLSGRYRVIAPDNLGSGFSDKPNPKEFYYDFDALAYYLDGFVTQLGLDKFVLYMQDFGAPVGFRLMMKDPHRIEAMIVQNANAYLEGIPLAKQDFFNRAQTDQSPENVTKLYAFTSASAVKNQQYLRDVSDRIEVMSPDTWTHDSYFLASDMERNIQVQLFQDYKTNLDAYPAWQQFLRKHQFPTLIVWGARDPVFTADGARAYLNDLPNAELHLLDAGHFAVEEKAILIAKLITSFLGDSTFSGTILEQKNKPLIGLP